MANPASIFDLESRWRTLTSQESNVAATFLEDGWRMLKGRVVDIETRVAASADFSAEVVRVLCAAVLRVLKNPDGKRQESIDDYSYTRDAAVSSGELYFTDAEIDSLAESVRGRAFSFSVLPPGYPDATFQ